MTPTDPLDELENRLRRRLVPGLPPGLRDRVLAEVVEVARPRVASAWRFAIGLAAAVLIGLNLAGMAANEAFSGRIVPRLFPPTGASVSSVGGAAVAPRLGSPWLPCDLPGRR